MADRPPTGTRDVLTTKHASPPLAGGVLFAVLVLALSASQLLPALLERVGVASPAWLDGLLLLVGGGFSPLWAVLIAGTPTLGWAGVRRILRTGLRLRVDGRLYLVAVLGAAGITGLAAALAAVVAGTRPAFVTGALPAPLAISPAAWLAETLLLAPLIVLAENLGWRAWLQRVLQVRVTPLVAGLLVGIVWSFWHLPLFALVPLYQEFGFLPFLLATVTRSVLLAALFNAARGSVMPVAVAHLAFNIATQMVLPEDLGDTTPLFLGVAAVSAVVSALLVWWTRSTATEHRPALL